MEVFKRENNVFVLFIGHTKNKKSLNDWFEIFKNCGVFQQNSMSFYVFDFYIGHTNAKRPHADIAQ